MFSAAFGQEAPCAWLAKNKKNYRCFVYSACQAKGSRKPAGATRRSSARKLSAFPHPGHKKRSLAVLRMSGKQNARACCGHRIPAPTKSCVFCAYQAKGKCASSGRCPCQRNRQPQARGSHWAAAAPPATFVNCACSNNPIKNTNTHTHTQKQKLITFFSVPRPHGFCRVLPQAFKKIRWHLGLVCIVSGQLGQSYCTCFSWR